MNTERSMMHRTMESYDPMVIGCSPSQQQDMVVQSCYHAAVWSFTTKAVPEEIWIQAASENVWLLLVRGKLSEITLCFGDILHVHDFGKTGTDFKVTPKKRTPRAPGPKNRQERFMPYQTWPFLRSTLHAGRWSCRLNNGKTGYVLMLLKCKLRSRITSTVVD